MYKFKPASAIVCLLATLHFGCQASNLENTDLNKRSETTKMTEAELLKLGTKGPPQLEVDEEAGIVSLTTVSTGCTKPEHFTIDVDSQGNYVGNRIKPDRCRRRAFVITYQYPLDGLPKP